MLFFITFNPFHYEWSSALLGGGPVVPRHTVCLCWGRASVNIDDSLWVSHRRRKEAEVSDWEKCRLVSSCLPLKMGGNINTYLTYCEDKMRKCVCKDRAQRLLPKRLSGCAHYCPVSHSGPRGVLETHLDTFRTKWIANAFFVDSYACTILHKFMWTFHTYLFMLVFVAWFLHPYIISILPTPS